MSLGKLITNLQTALTNEDEKDDKNYLSRFQLQGEKYLKYNEMRTNEIKPQFKLMENFSIINNNAVETKNNKEIQALIDLDKEYKKKLSDYSEQRQILMRDTNMYLNKMSSSENKLLGNNIRFDNGEIGYVTGEGVYKKYDSFDLYQNTIGKNGCPSNYEQLNINRDGDKISTNPPLNLGTPMAWGQSCGNAGKNVYVINSEEPDEPTYVGCYKSSSENGLTYQSDMGSTSDVNSCKYRAFDKGNGVFAVGSGGKGTSKCYIGTNLDKAKSGGEAKIYKETWNTGGPFTDSTRAGLNNAGQLIITNNNNSQIYYTSNPPQEGCDPKYGGGINLSNTVATWGGNCLNVSNTTTSTPNTTTTSIPASKWLGKLIRIKGGELGYVTNEGVYRPYHSKDTRKFNMGKNGCPNEIFVDLKSTTRTDKILNSDPPLKVGPPMEKGESCLSNNNKPNSNTPNSNTPNTNLDVKQGNWTTYLKTLNIEGNPTGDFVLGNTSAPSPFNVDPAKNCAKDFRANYQCGTGIAKNIFIDKEAGGKGVVFDCRKEYNACRGYTLVMQDDGNLVIYKDGGQAIWSSKTTSNFGVNNLSKSASKGKNGRNYLNGGEYLNDGEFIGSPKGNCYLQMTKGVGLQIMISIPGCSVVGDETYGLINTNENKKLKFNIYNGYFDENVNYFSNAKSIGNGYSDNFNDLSSATAGLKRENTGDLYSVEWNGFFVPNFTGNWQFKTRSDDKSYLWLGNNANSGYNINNTLVKNLRKNKESFSNEATIKLDANVYYPIRIQFGNKGGPDYFQLFIKSPNGSYTTNGSGLFFNSPPPINSLAVYTIPIASGSDNIGKVGYVTSDNKLKEYPQELISKSNKYIELGNFSNEGNDIKTINVKSSEECMTGCNETEGCEGFVFNSNGTCSLKNSNMYPKTPRIKSSNGDVLYKRSVGLKNNNSCSKNVVPINGSLWNNYVKDGNMTEDVLCNLGYYTKEQQAKLETSHKDLQKTINEIHTRLLALDETDKKLLDSYGLNKKKLENDMATFHLAYKEKDNANKEIYTLQGMQDASEDEMISENYKNIVWSIVAILLVIGSIKLLK